SHRPARSLALRRTRVGEARGSPRRTRRLQLRCGAVSDGPSPSARPWPLPPWRARRALVIDPPPAPRPCLYADRITSDQDAGRRLRGFAGPRRKAPAGEKKTREPVEG